MNAASARRSLEHTGCTVLSPDARTMYCTPSEHHTSVIKDEGFDLRVDRIEMVGTCET